MRCSIYNIPQIEEIPAKSVLHLAVNLASKCMPILFWMVSGNVDFGNMSNFDWIFRCNVF